MLLSFSWRETMLNRAEFSLYRPVFRRFIGFSKIAYQVSDGKEIRLPEGFRVLCTSQNHDSLVSNYYFGICFINADNTEMIIASAGSRMNSKRYWFWDLCDDLAIFASIFPFKTAAVKKFNNHILEALERERIDMRALRMGYIGHSLGAALAEIGAADMQIKLMARRLPIHVGEEKRIFCVSYESPGTTHYLEDIYKKHGLGIHVFHQHVDSICLNHHENIINIYGIQVGRVFRFVSKKVLAELSAQRWSFFGYLLHGFSSLVANQLPLLSRLLNTFLLRDLSTQFSVHGFRHIEAFLNKDESREDLVHAMSVTSFDRCERAGLSVNPLIELPYDGKFYRGMRAFLSETTRTFERKAINYRMQYEDQEMVWDLYFSRDQAEKFVTQIDDAKEDAMGCRTFYARYITQERLQEGLVL